MKLQRRLSRKENPLPWSLLRKGLNLQKHWKASEDTEEEDQDSSDDDDDDGDEISHLATRISRAWIKQKKKNLVPKKDKKEKAK